jgi:hypothetical protein
VDIDDAVRFFNALLDTEHAHAIGRITELDDEFHRRIAALDAFMHDMPGSHAPVSLSVSRMPGQTAAELTEYAGNLELLARRNLFLVVEYDHPEGGQLFAGHVSHDRRHHCDEYHELWYAADIAGELKLIARYIFEGGAPPLRWRCFQGATIENPGWLVTARAIIEPGRISHRWHWTDIRDSAARRPQRSGPAVIGGSEAWQRATAGPG